METYSENNMGGRMNFAVRQVLVCVLVPSFTNRIAIIIECFALEQLLVCYESQFPHLQNRGNTYSYL